MVEAPPTATEPTLPDSPDDTSLLRQLQSGDPKALDALLRAHGDRMFALAYSLLGRRPEHRMDAEDVVQESLLGALKSAKRFEGRSSLSTWLSRIVANQVLALRRYKRVRKAESFDEGQVRPGHLMSNDASMDVERMLGALSDEHREVIVLREIQGLTYEEISEALDIPKGTVESRLFRARQALKEKFPEFLA
jgi:RNA polymerase sigma-70 factor (ECF subfamily)